MYELGRQSVFQVSRLQEGVTEKEMTNTKENMATIIYFDDRKIVSCDGKCNKAWGLNSRPIKNQEEVNKDLNSGNELLMVDYIYFEDDELGEAPINPGTYEGGEGKPISPNDFPNKWCVRECERCKMI